jgi:hypothetical protein
VSGRVFSVWGQTQTACEVPCLKSLRRNMYLFPESKRQICSEIYRTAKLSMLMSAFTASCRENADTPPG